ncbi:MAG: glycosyltransferase [Alphaproteobacteria bacterium]|nr:glycosyltransferase [Alphaproteobacteria bacterium]MBV9372944.1 glycosyltransferase [Alphaproteobacteria bacterium]MBV9900937.1 glycosyltransferase [Alphaproteobacteria bacterium]
MATILYLTQDGITDHIGQAQIAPYLMGLARLGHSIHIVSAEKAGREEPIARYRALFDAVGIRWTRVRYANRPPLVSSFWTMRLMARAAERIAAAERPDLVHCRSYLPLGLAARLKRRFGMKYLADFRDFWADVGIETKRFKFVYRWFLAREPALLGNADHVVTLTDRAADLLIARHPHVAGGRRDNYTVIPCCADFALFDPAKVDPAAAERRRQALAIPAGAPVLLYLGSLGADYLLVHMMDLFRELRAIRPDAVFLFLANNGRELVEAEAARHGIPGEALRFTSSDRRDIPEYLALASVSAVFIRPTLSKAGCSPTKLGELFAMNVPIVANSGYGDIDRIVSPERNGSVVVKDFAPATLRAALETVLSHPERGGTIRAASGEFSLEEGVRRYDRIYRKLAGASEGAGATVVAGEAC